MSDLPYVARFKNHQITFPESLLTHIDIELTERCNNACIHCLINQPEHDERVRVREMDTAFIKSILTQAAGLGCLIVRFTGGEPLLRDDFAELYLFARRLGMFVILFTNARRITSEIAGLLAKFPPGREVEVTVYGMHPMSYDTAAASRGAFRELWRGIELLREYKIPFIVKQSILPSNRDEIEEFEAFAASLPHMNQKPGYAMNFDLRARRDNLAKNNLIKTLRLTPEETVKRMARNPDALKMMPEFAAKYMGPTGDRLFNCGAGTKICVDAYGNAQMCMGLRHPEMVYSLGEGKYSKNIGSETLDQIKENGSSLKYVLTDFFPRLLELKATNPDYLQRCARCFIKGLCEQCPAKSWQEHGTLDTPVEYFCQVAHAQARYLGLIVENEKSWEIEPEIWKARVKQFTSSID